MKKLIPVVILISLLFSFGFKREEKPYVILSSAPTAKENINRVERVFNAGQRIYYCLVIPSGAKYSGIRMQLSNQSDKTTNWGFSIIQSRDFYMEKSDRIYKSYFYAQKNGHYIIQFFYLNKKNYPFVHKEFMVQ